MPPDAVHLGAGPAAHFPDGQAQVGHGPHLTVGRGDAVVPGQEHDKVQCFVLQPFEPGVARKFEVVQHEANAVTAQQFEADLEDGDALGGVGIAAAVVEQFPVERHMPTALVHGHAQDVDLALAHVPLGAVDAQA